jgi:Putative prokaryotic signal transducing protein
VTARIDRKLEEVAVGEFRYRHEAEFAAGFLKDAGIPYRLQIDDAGGADLGLLHQHPAVLWVRAVDADAARELLATDEEGSE